MSRSRLAHLLLLGVVLVWGSTFALVKAALADVTPLLFNLLRMLLAFLCLAIVYRKHWRGMTPRIVASGAITGLFLAAGYQFQTAGLFRTSSTKTAFITGLVVVLVPLLSAIPGLRPPRLHSAPAGTRKSNAPAWNAWLGAFLAFAGIVFLTTPAHTPWATLFSTLNLGDLLSFGCAVSFALHLISIAHTTQRVPFEQLALLQVGFCALFMSISTPLLEHSTLILSSRLVLTPLIAAILATAAAFTIQSWAQQHIPATNTALLLSLEPVFAWITAFLFLHERLSLRAAAGALLVLAGILITELIRPASHNPVQASLADAPV